MGRLLTIADLFYITNDRIEPLQFLGENGQYAPAVITCGWQTANERPHFIAPGRIAWSSYALGWAFYYHEEWGLDASSGRLTLHKASKYQLTDAGVIEYCGYLKDNIAMVPLQDAVETLGGEVNISGIRQPIRITIGKQTVLFVLGSQRAYVNGKEVALSSRTTIIDGIIYVPLRLIAETTGTAIQDDKDQYGIRRMSIILITGTAFRLVLCPEILSMTDR